VKINNLRLKILLVILFSLIFNLKSVPAHAQAQPGITVTPSIIHIDLATDPADYELSYFNNTKTDIALTFSAQDFTELEDSYKISFLTGKDDANYKYSLSSWISFETKSIQLSPGETKSVKISIDKNRITKGGHYASILAEVQQPETNKQVVVKAVLSSLLFVRASTGKEIEDGKISDFTALRDGIEYPDEYQVRFQNNGNVHVIPYGVVKVFDPLGNMVAKGPFNVDSLDALPESIRRYQTKVVTYQKILFPGVYTAKVELIFGKTNQKVTANIRFFSQGMFDFVQLAVFMTIAGILIIYFKRKLKKSPTNK